MLVLRSPFVGSALTRLGVPLKKTACHHRPDGKDSAGSAAVDADQAWYRTLRPDSLTSNTTTRSASFAAANVSSNACGTPDSLRRTLVCAKR